MKCPRCGHDDTKVLESRLSHEGRSVRRRRACQDCQHRFTTYEKEESFVFSIRKKDGRVEPYNRTKLLTAVQTACQKRPIMMEQIEGIVARIEKAVQESGERTVPSERIGDFVMNELADIDKVAYIRFASVYKDFQEPEEFMNAFDSFMRP